jgi:membrane protein
VSHAVTTESGENELLADAPDKPSELGRDSWKDTLKRTAKGFKRDELSDRAAALTYYGLLSIFPMTIALISTIGLLGKSATDSVVEELNKVATGPAREVVTTAVENVGRSRGTATLLFILSIALAIWSASKYVDAFMRTSNAVYGAEEGRPAWKRIPVRLGITIAIVLLLAATALSVALSGGLARQVGDALGMGSTAVTVWNIIKWPILAILFGIMLVVLYSASPNVRQPGIRWVTPGTIAAVVVWLVAAAGFALYLAFFNSYNKTYGAMAGIIIFLIWLWITNLAVLVGLELNAELQRSRAIEAGDTDTDEGFPELRDTSKLPDD